MKEERKKETILKNIVSKRTKMIETGGKKGLTNWETIKMSQELDRLLNRYMGIMP